MKFKYLSPEETKAVKEFKGPASEVRRLFGISANQLFAIMNDLDQQIDNTKERKRVYMRDYLERQATNTALKKPEPKLRVVKFKVGERCMAEGDRYLYKTFIVNGSSALIKRAIDNVNAEGQLVYGKPLEPEIPGIKRAELVNLFSQDSDGDEQAEAE